MTREKVASILLVTGMLGVAALLTDMEVIFPEIIALAVGAWVVKRCPWQSSSINIFLSPTLAAFTGMALLKFFPYRPFYLICVAFILVVIELQLLQSDVYPAISAAILPIIVHADSWIYAVAVGVLTGIVLLGKLYFDKEKGMELAYSRKPWLDQNSSFIPNGWQFWLKVFVAVALIAAVAVGADSIYLLAPPLIVAFIELSQPDSDLWHKPFKLWFLITLAAFFGLFWLVVTVDVFKLPFWAFGVFAVSWMFLLYHWFDMYLPPAGALSLLPVIVPPESLMLYPFQVSLGCLMFVILAKVIFRRPEEKGETLQVNGFPRSGE